MKIVNLYFSREESSRRALRPLRRMLPFGSFTPKVISFGFKK